MGTYVKNTRCTECESSTGLVIYKEEDGTVNGTCFKCEKYFNNRKLNNVEHTETRKSYYKPQLTRNEVLEYPIRGESDRFIVPEVNERFGIRVSKDEITCEDDTVYYPYYIKTKLSGFKVRVLPKHFTSDVGNTSGCDLFGQHLCSMANKKIIITEGEEDCLAVYQELWRMSGEKRHPNVVSLKNGAGDGKNIEKSSEFLNHFETVILCLDNDQEGIRALNRICSILDLKKIKIMKLPRKDASECLQAGDGLSIREAFHNLQDFVPYGIVKISECRDRYFNHETVLGIDYPWKEFNRAAGGIKFGDLDTFTADTSSGKTQLMREIIYHLLESTDVKIGAIFLEETLDTTLSGLGSISINQRLTLNDVRKSVSEGDLKRSWDSISRDNRLVFRDNTFMDIDDSSLFNMITYMASVSGCKVIVLDHLSYLVSLGGKDTDERKRIDFLMTKLKALAIQLNVWIGIVVHLRRSGRGVPFDRGGVPSLHDLRGSGGLEQISNSVYFIQRNRFHSEEPMRNVMRLHIFKNRYSGECGGMDYLEYDGDTGRIYQLPGTDYTIIEDGVE